MITRQSPSWVIYSILRYDEGGKQRRARKQIWRNKPHVGFRLTWDLLEVGTEDPLPPLWFIRNGVQGPHLLITLAGGGVGGLEPPVLLVSQKWTHKNCGIWVGVEVCVCGGGGSSYLDQYQGIYLNCTIYPCLVIWFVQSGDKITIQIDFPLPMVSFPEIK